MLARVRPLLGTLVEIRVLPIDTRTARLAVDEAFAAVAEVHRLMSYHDPDSDVSRLNRRACHEAVPVDPQTWRVLACAQRLSEASAGLFDCTVGARLVKLGYLPETDCPAPSAANVSYRDMVLLDDNRVRFLQPLRVDLGGIAKGYAVDQAIAVLREYGVAWACVNAGGDLRVFGDRDWLISVRSPDDPGYALPAIRLRNAAVATTANYFAAKVINGIEVSPLIEPRTGFSRTGRQSVSVLAPGCMHADALTKVVWLSGDQEHPALAAFEARAFILNGDRETMSHVA